MPAPGGVDADDYNGAFVISVAIDSHRVLIIDPTYDNIHQSSVREFDTRTGEWDNEGWPSLNQPRSDFGCVLCNGKVYVIGGNGSHGECLNSIECLDLSASPRQWITMSQTLTLWGGEIRCEAQNIGKKVYIAHHAKQDEGERNAIVSIDLFDTESGDLVPCLNLPSENDVVLPSWVKNC
jgi:hypothetical protein